MSQQLSCSRPWSPIPGSESHFAPRSLQPLTQEVGGSAVCLSRGHRRLLELSLSPEITEPPISVCLVKGGPGHGDIMAWWPFLSVPPGTVQPSARTTPPVVDVR